MITCERVFLGLFIMYETCCLRWCYRVTDVVKCWIVVFVLLSMVNLCMFGLSFVGRDVEMLG